MTGDDTLARVIRVASRAPSAHNAQPWRVRRDGDRVELGLHDDRLLKAGDPTGRDALLGLGCWLEAASISAVGEGRSLEVAFDETGLAEFSADPSAAPAAPLAVMRLVVGAAPTPFTADDVRERAVHRGGLAPIGDDAGMNEALGEGWLRIARVPPARAPRLVALGDAGALGRGSVAAEAVEWMRFTPREARFDRDGLTAPALRIPGWAAAIGGALKRSRPGRAALSAGVAVGSRLSPAVAGLQRSHPGLFVLVAESPSRGAAGIAGSPDRPAGLGAREMIAAGRALMRAWLAAHAAGVSVAPASQVVDAPRALAELRRELRLRPAEVAVAVFAAGEPIGPTPRSPRLPA